MKISANDIRSGNILDYKNQLWIVIKNPDRIKPGKGGAYVQVQMKNIHVGTKLNQRFSSTDTVEKAFLDHLKMQYLYADANHLVFMDSESFEQINIDAKLLEDKVPLLTDGMEVNIDFYQEQPVRVILPQTVVVQIIETEPIIKGATITSSYKPAIVANGLKVMVPSYIKNDEKIVIKTEDLSFVERVSK